MKLRLILLTLIFSAFNAVISKADISGDWKVYPSFDNEFRSVVDTPDKVYMIAYGQPYRENKATLSSPMPYLFVYDKENDEIMGYSKRNYLSESLVLSVDYNPVKKYVLIIYKNYNIDIIDENGSMKNIPGLMTATIANGKNVNCVSFDPERNRIYLATDFGYLEINDDKFEIADSRIYNQPLYGAGRVGDKFVVFDAEQAYWAPVDSDRRSLEAYTPITNMPTPSHIMTTDKDDTFYAFTGKNHVLRDCKFQQDNSVIATRVMVSGDRAYQRNRDGYIVFGDEAIAQVNMDGTNSVREITPSGIENIRHGSWDGKNIWTGMPREGLKGQRLEDDGTWTVTHESMLPSAPNMVISQYMQYVPKYGLVAAGHGYNRLFGSVEHIMPFSVSGMQDGFWTSYSPTFRNKDRLNGNFFLDPAGLAVDPDDNKYMYFGSRWEGMIRINLDDPQDILHMSHPTDRDKDNPGFVVIVDDLPAYPEMCQFSPLSFDSSGNLWALLVDDSKGQSVPGYGRFWVWPSDKRKAGDPSGWINFDENGIVNFDKGFDIVALNHSRNKNLLVVNRGPFDGEMYVIDHKGTLEDSSDDTVAVLANVFDQDGTAVTKHYVYSIYEDPSTGLVWVGTFNGVFYIDPKASLTSPSTVYRVKVSRNDGTNLADYLLDNVAVNKITSDNMGRLWFGTSGGGLFCTSNDGKEILAQFTTDNSYLPSNTIFGLCYNPDTNSMMISTEEGMCEFFMRGATGSGSNVDLVRAYPNPVRPDYLGWVTVDGLPDNALVKIVDASGNIVAEPGISSGGSVQWDVCNMHGNRVQTGVYYVAVSSAEESLNFAKMAKILVVN